VTNSSAWTRQGPFDIGVSRVYCNNSASKIRDINHTRLGHEEIHYHPDKDDKKFRYQLEGYIITQGKAVYCKGKKGEQKVMLLNKGDMILIKDEVQHALISTKGEYEHLVFQSPSTFQYGLSFKENVGQISPDLINKAKNILKSS